MSESKRWILLRGLGRHSSHWGEFLPRFQRQFPNAEIETLDLAGNGTENARKSFLKVEDYVEDLRSRSQLLKKGKVSLLAVSMGAMVAANWAEKHPREIGDLILMNTSDSLESYFFERLRPTNYLALLNILRKPDDLFHREKTLLQLTAGELPHLDRIAEVQSKFPPTSAENFLRQLYASSRFGFPKSQPVRRSLFIVAEGDGLVHPNCSKRLAARWGAPLRAHPRADHDLPLIDPDWVVRQVSDFVGSD